MSFSIVAIDGPAASGKSTVSRRLAAKLRYAHMDTGSLYRALTWKVLRAGVSLENEDALVSLARATQVVFFIEDGEIHFTLDGQRPGSEIRSAAVAEQVSLLAAIPRIRVWVVEQLRTLVRFGDLVMEGRDIGTAVFPDANFKFYLDADPLERARRRQAEAPAAEAARSLKYMHEALLRRDALDSGRQSSPLLKAPDAQLIDSTKMSLDEVVTKIAKLIHQQKDAAKGEL